MDALKNEYYLQNGAGFKLFQAITGQYLESPGRDDDGRALLLALFDDDRSVIEADLSGFTPLDRVWFNIISVVREKYGSASAEYQTLAKDIVGC